MAAHVRRLGSSGTYLPSVDNVGPGGGFALGLRHAQTTSVVDWYWLLDDDSPPTASALETALRTAHELGPDAAAIGMSGGLVRCGRIRHDLRAGSVDTPTEADFILVDGAIISAPIVAAVGYPREDFFIMMEDLEYSLRIREAGFPVFVRPSDGSRNLYQGSGATWRNYYQARNHLRMAIERRSFPWAWGWMTREGGILVHHLRRRRWQAITMRLRGARDAIRNRMGRTIEPR